MKLTTHLHLVSTMSGAIPLQAFMAWTGKLSFLRFLKCNCQGVPTFQKKKLLPPFSGYKMQAAYFSERSVPTYKITWRHLPENYNLKIHPCKNLTSHMQPTKVSHLQSRSLRLHRLGKVACVDRQQLMLLLRRATA